MKIFGIFSMVAALALTATIGFAGCSSAPAASGTSQATEDNSLQKVKDSGKFIFGIDATFKPMGYTD